MDQIMHGQMTWKITTRPAPAHLSDLAARLSSVGVLAYLGFAYWLFNYALPGELSADTNVYIVRPAVWGGLGLLSLYLWRRVSDRPLVDRLSVLLALLASAFSVATLICAGILFGFGHSPYARDAVHMSQNVWYLSTFIFGLEMSRSYLVVVWSKVNTVLAFTAVALLYAAVSLAPGQFDAVTAGNENSLHTFGITFMPGISESVMATFLASMGGPIPAFIYHFSLEAFRWLSPILPRLDWTVAAFVGTLTPAVAMLIVRDAYLNSREVEAEAAEHASEQLARPGGVSPLVLFTGVVIVAAIWLYSGLFGVTPYLVSGPSMKPGFTPGDIVVARGVDPEEIKVGDVLRIKATNGYVFHRVVSVHPTANGLWFTTKGDNNNTNDPPVHESRVAGRIVFDIPYVGWVPIKIKEFLN
jgi:signal peptidase